ncbi:sperm-associated antigen 16 protein-like isoform X2 [Coregonus clupeaformis]|uniref:sperm-associated antigen 16 protein-like isoform X2 n=1 Tax=Coregonus clupeaformis TaxID=59861 RepID=UPI001E1C7A25|nr:sperm-associated antigen 16 protein-like isoform X2 [Coregonus clupeaformis]
MAFTTAKLQSKTVYRIAEVVNDFPRNFLVSMGMDKTLNCFQTEWNEMAHKCLFNAEDVGLVPDVYTQKHFLSSELKNAQRERGEYRQTASAAGQTLVKLRKARDFHKRVGQEKKRLIEDIRKLKTHGASYDPALKQMNEKYQAALKQKMLVSLERDKALGQAHSLDVTLHNTLPSQPPHPTSECSLTPNKTGVTTSTRGMGSVFTPPPKTQFPPDTCVNPQLAHRGKMSVCSGSFKVAIFRLTNTLKAHTLPVSFLALHRSKLVVASASDDQLWRLPEGVLIATGQGHSDWLSGDSLHPDGAKLGATSVQIWDLSEGCCDYTATPVLSTV